MSTYSSFGSDTNQSGPNEAKANCEGLDGEGPMTESIRSGSTSDQVAIEGGVDALTKLPFDRISQPRLVDADASDVSMREGGQDEVEELAVRDGQFYIDSADCVIRVDNTLFRPDSLDTFNVHRYFLGRDSSTFQHMFSMPAENQISSQTAEGCSDENPIRLRGESLERFRALLSVLYDLPLQLQMYNTPGSDIERLLTIAEMSNKYHFVSVETWAINALYNVISGLYGPPQLQYELGHCTSLWMKRLLEIALLCRHTALRDYIAEQWVDRILARDLRPVHALEIADRASIRRLQGYAYYVQLLEMDGNFEPGVAEDGKQHSRLVSTLVVAGPDGNEHVTSPSTPASLTREQRERLLLGHWSLVRLWARIRKEPPRLQHMDGCTNHQQGCVSTWRLVWRDVGKSEATLKHPVEDVPGRLRAMEQQLFMSAEMQAYLTRAMTLQCKRGAVVALKATIKGVQEGLADHFVSHEVAEGAS